MKYILLILTLCSSLLSYADNTVFALSNVNGRTIVITSKCNNQLQANTNTLYVLVLDGYQLNITKKYEKYFTKDAENYCLYNAKDILFFRSLCKHISENGKAVTTNNGTGYINLITDDNKPDLISVTSKNYYDYFYEKLKSFEKGLIVE